MRRKKSPVKKYLKWIILTCLVTATSLYAYFRTQLTLAPINVVSTTSDPYSQIKSVTYYMSGNTPESTYDRLAKDIPTLKRAGFNSIWLVYTWVYFDPNPLVSPRVYNQSSFNTLKRTLDLLKANNMQAILPMEYFGSGWAPRGIEYDGWVKNPQTYAVYKQFVNEYMRQIESYHDMVYLLFTSENAMFGHSWNDAVANARAQRATLGNIPNELDQNLRKRFRLGFHDFILINLDWSSCLGSEIKTFANHCGTVSESPITNPNPFDFVSMVGYESLDSYNGASRSWKQEPADNIRTNLQARADRFRHLYPTTPLIMGEYGYRGCENAPVDQARIVKTTTQFALDNHIGFNLWGWKYSTDECSNAGLDGLALTNAGGTPRLAAKEVKQLLNPTTITSAGVNPAFNPWAVWVKGNQIENTLVVNLYRNDKLWVARHPAFVAADKTFVSFNLPSNPTPTDKIEFVLVDNLGFTSNQFKLTF